MEINYYHEAVSMVAETIDNRFEISKIESIDKLENIQNVVNDWLMNSDEKEALVYLIDQVVELLAEVLDE